MFRDILADNGRLREKLKSAKAFQPMAAAAASVAAALPPAAEVGQPLVQQPAGPVFEPGWAASSAATAAAGSTPAGAASGTKHKRAGGSSYRSVSNGSGHSRSSRRERFLGTAFARGGDRAGKAAAVDVDGEEAVRLATEAREACRAAMAGDTADAARPQHLG